MAMTESAGTVLLSIDGYTRSEVDNLISSNSASLSDSSVTGLTLRTGSELKRLHVAGPLSFIEATSGPNLSYSQSATDSLLLAKQLALSISGVSGYSLETDFLFPNG